MNTRPERTIAVLIPAWPVLAAGAAPDRPAATAGKDRITAYTTPAAARGVRRGQRVREAQRHCPDLEIHHDDPVRDARAFEPVVLALESAAVGVEIVRPGLCVLRASRPARYYGGEPKTAAVLRDAVAGVEVGTPAAPPVCGIGIADGSFAAVLAARVSAAATPRPRPADAGTPAAGPAAHRAREKPLVVEPGGGAGFLAPYPVAALERPELADLLNRLGVHTLGAFAALAGADVANRFGADGLLAHRLARGLDPHPPAPRRPPEDLSAVHEFDPPAEQDGPVVFVAKMLADRLHALLGSAGLSCVRLRIEITTAAGRQCSRTWRYGDAAGRPVSGPAVANMVRWQLDSWRARESEGPAGPGSGPDPVAVLSLMPDQLVTDTGAQQALWGREEAPDRVERAAERVQAMLGHAGVVRLHLVGGRDPAARAAPVPWGGLPNGGAHPDPRAPWPGAVPPPAPPVVPPEPLPADLRDAAGGPVSVTGRARLTAPPAALAVSGQTLRVTGWAGPWPYDERHWDPATRRRRARMQCSTADGRAWLLAVEGGAWRVEGVHQ